MLIMKYSFLKSKWFPLFMGFSGVILGTIITGLFTINIQNKVNEMNKSLFIGQKSLNDRELFIKQLFEYEDLLNKYLGLLVSQKNLTEEEVVKFELEVMNSGQKLMFVSNTSIGINTSLLNSEMGFDLAYKNFKWLKNSTFKSKFDEVYGIWLASILEFINNKEAVTIPGENTKIVIKEIETNRQMIQSGLDSLLKKYQEK
jgi:hypothetical protein